MADPDAAAARPDLRCDFTAAAPNTRWVADFTYVPISTGHGVCRIHDRDGQGLVIGCPELALTCFNARLQTIIFWLLIVNT